jgi:hypothetical protein
LGDALGDAAGDALKENKDNSFKTKTRITNIMSVFQ